MVSVVQVVVSHFAASTPGRLPVVPKVVVHPLAVGLAKQVCTTVISVVRVEHVEESHLAASTVGRLPAEP